MVLLVQATQSKELAVILRWPCHYNTWFITENTTFNLAGEGTKNSFKKQKTLCNVC